VDVAGVYWLYNETIRKGYSAGGEFMAITQTTQANLEEFSRCEDRSRMAEKELRLDPKADRSDASIAGRVGRALWDDGVLRSTDYREIDVAVKDGIVFLSGHVLSSGNKKRAETAAGAVAGVLEVKSNLVADDQLTRDVAGALGKVEHQYRVKFFTGVSNGVVSLNGTVGSIHVQTVAENCAAGVAGVRGVVSSMRTSEADGDKEDQRFLQPAIGKQIYFRDGLSATVHKVVINPNNLRVIAMVLRSQLLNSAEHGFKSYSEDRVPERLVVIPVSDLRYLTQSSGFLYSNSAEAAGGSDFDHSAFTSPPVDWAPPYPYCPDDVLFLL
jgi:osmotically-inducible protein OsmY